MCEPNGICVVHGVNPRCECRNGRSTWPNCGVSAMGEKCQKMAFWMAYFFINMIYFEILVNAPQQDSYSEKWSKWTSSIKMFNHLIRIFSVSPTMIVSTTKCAETGQNKRCKIQHIQITTPPGLKKSNRHAVTGPRNTGCSENIAQSLELHRFSSRSLRIYT